MARTKRLPIDHALRMTPEEYMKDRVDDQIKWYSAKSRENKRWFLRLEIAAILFSVSIPFVTDFITPTTTYMKTVVSFLGVAIAFITGLLSLMKYRDNWVEYRSTAEMLHRERFLYLTRSGAYASSKSFVLFVQAVEDILASEVSTWKNHQTMQDDHEEEHHEAEGGAAGGEAASAPATVEAPQLNESEGVSGDAASTPEEGAGDSAPEGDQPVS